MSTIEKRRGGGLAPLDTALAVVGVVGAVLLLLWIAGAVVGLVLFVVKLAVLAAVVALVVRLVHAVRRR